LKGAFLNGWLTADYFGLDRDTARRAMTEAAPRTRNFRVELREIGFASHDGIKANYTTLDTHDLADNTLCLQKLGCLDLVDARPAIETLLRHQVLANSLPPGRRPDLDPKLLHGLFETSGFDPIQDTWESLVLLETFGALDRIDREGCVNGILRFHYGEGLFGSVRTGDQFVIWGDARDTFFAFESLRMLNALDRVKDLDNGSSAPCPLHNRQKTARRGRSLGRNGSLGLPAAVRAHLARTPGNPQAPVRSLREPGNI